MHVRRRTDSFRTKLFGQSKRVAGEEIVRSTSSSSGAAELSGFMSDTLDWIFVEIVLARTYPKTPMRN